MKAFIFTLDSIFSLLMFFLLLNLVFSFSIGSETVESTGLRYMSMDVLTTAEKSGAFENFIKTRNSTIIRDVLRKTPDSFCAQMQITGSDLSNVTLVKPGCQAWVSEVQVLPRTVVYQKSIYLVKMQSWYKGDTDE